MCNFSQAAVSQIFAALKKVNVYTLLRKAYYAYLSVCVIGFPPGSVCAFFASRPHDAYSSHVYMCVRNTKEMF